MIEANEKKMENNPEGKNQGKNDNLLGLYIRTYFLISPVKYLVTMDLILLGILNINNVAFKWIYSNKELNTIYAKVLMILDV
jgi:hypothetical protein